MSDVNETLQDLLERRLREMGKRRGRGENISLHEAYQRLVDLHAAGTYEGKVPTYEVFRRIRNGHTRISDDTVRALATMLELDVTEVAAAAQMAPSLGRFELPLRADQLDDTQRQVVLSVVDAILGAQATAAAEVPSNVRELRAAAARDTGKLSRKQRQERSGVPDDADDFEPR